WVLAIPAETDIVRPDARGGTGRLGYVFHFSSCHQIIPQCIVILGQVGRAHHYRDQTLPVISHRSVFRMLDLAVNDQRPDDERDGNTELCHHEYFSGKGRESPCAE